MTAEQKFDAIRRRYLAASARLDAFGDTMRRKYGQTNPPSSWMTRGEDAKREAIDAAQSREMTAMFALLADISPRQWYTGVAAWWIMEHLTYADATTSGALSALPQAGYGTTLREIERFAEAA